jgi:hypothetical protein
VSLAIEYATESLALANTNEALLMSSVINISSQFCLGRLIDIGNNLRKPLQLVGSSNTVEALTIGCEVVVV